MLGIVFGMFSGFSRLLKILQTRFLHTNRSPPPCEVITVPQSLISTRRTTFVSTSEELKP
jgi:hypothetical protein